ncbi:MAG: SPOR domain-containing protein [Muribaculaceae bacterium]
MNRFLLLFFAAFCAFSALAQSQASIVEHIQSASQGRVTVNQPAKLTNRLRPENGNPDNGTKATIKNRVGYRIQVFADKNQRTAKSEALSRERNVQARFPELGCYLSYNAPTWRMRVGDFLTREEALEMMQQLKKEFPSYAREMIVVKDRINVTL